MSQLSETFMAAHIEHPEVQDTDLNCTYKNVRQAHGPAETVLKSVIPGCCLGILLKLLIMYMYIMHMHVCIWGYLLYILHSKASLE